MKSSAGEGRRIGSGLSSNTTGAATVSNHDAHAVGAAARIDLEVQTTRKCKAAIFSRSYLVNTVGLGDKSAVQGSGNITLKASRAGSRFMINAAAPNGAAITRTIQCSAFTQPMAEGG